MKIYIGADHNGAELEKRLIKEYKGAEIESVDLNHDPLDDYPKFALKLAQKVAQTNSLGILICGTGIGMSIVANKVDGIRAARCTSIRDVRLAREHNDANVLCLGKNHPYEKYVAMIDAFIGTQTSSDERHKRRANQIMKVEQGAYNEL